ncbi:hypothetical protein CDAR_583481 [Caerostris darwini]|uniref:Uncharacterized protein n=1 Tax=Caerostris darwini TaxID=1538125 RepID=A0AAV4PVL2_9ARAC|nr:hypothetical protein CDAR_583481 [Caerostris darwini]
MRKEKWSEGDSIFSEKSIRAKVWCARGGLRLATRCAAPPAKLCSSVWLSARLRVDGMIETAWLIVFLGCCLRAPRKYELSGYAENFYSP